MRRRPPRFDLIAGNVCLDFVNTLDDRYTKPKELLETYIDLVRFGEDTGVLDSRQVDHLFERGQSDPDRAQKVLGWARELREAIHDVFRALMDKKSSSAGAPGKAECVYSRCDGSLATGGGEEWLRMDVRRFRRVGQCTVADCAICG